MVKAVLLSVLALLPQPLVPQPLVPQPIALAQTQVESAVVVCDISEEGASELSGLIATGNGYVAINDSNWDPSATRIFYLDKKCRISRTVSYPTAARDPEDLVAAGDGTLWIADVGDNFNAPTRRPTVALWKLAKGSKKPVIHRFTYPDGPHDAEAMLLDGAGQPLIVTKELDGAAGVYAPSRAPEPNTSAGVPLVKVGEVKLPSSTTPNPWGAVGRRTITGAAASPDGRYVTLRTYADAYEWRVNDGDVLAAITTTDPVATALPDEPQGEAIAYTADGTGYLTVSDQPGATQLQRYPVPARPVEQTEGSDAEAKEGPRQPTDHANAGMIGISALALLAALGILGAIWRSRRRAG